MSITVTKDMKYTRSGEVDESNVISAYDTLIWEFNDNSIAGVAAALVQLYLLDNDGNLLYTSPDFPAYLLSGGGGSTAYFRFDGSQICKNIINYFFYKELSSGAFIEAENYGLELQVVLITYDGAVQEDDETVEYFLTHGMNQIGDESGANIPRIFYNDTEEVAHFLGYPNKLFFFTDADITEMALEIINNDITEVDNIVTGWTNQSYETFTVAGVAITSAIETGTAGVAKSNSFAIIEGEQYMIMIPDFVLNSGQYPTFTLVHDGIFSELTNQLRVYQAGNNMLILTCETPSSGNAQVWIRNTAAANWSCGDIRVRHVQDAIIDTSATLKYVFVADIYKSIISKKSITAKAYTDLDDMELLKTFNITVFDPCENAVYVRWLNTDGNYSYWAFSPFPSTSEESQNIGRVINSFNDMALANSRHYPIGKKDAFKKLAVASASVPIVFRRKLMEIFNSPAVYIWTGTPTLNENLITEWENSSVNPYDTLTVVGSAIIEGIESTGNIGRALSNSFEVTQGESIDLIFLLNINSGSLPDVRLVNASSLADQSNEELMTAGDNFITLVATATGTVQIMINTDNLDVANFATSRIKAMRKEVETDWILLEAVEGSHTLREKKSHDRFDCTLVLPERYTQNFGGQDI